MPDVGVGDSDHVGYTVRHLRQPIVEHKNSAIDKHFLIAHGDISLLKESQFRSLKGLTVSFMRCSSLKQRCPLSQHADCFHWHKAPCLRTFQHLLSFLVFKHFYPSLFFHFFDLIISMNVETSS